MAEQGKNYFKLTQREKALIVPILIILLFLPLNIFFDYKLLVVDGDGSLENNIAGIFAPLLSFIGSVLVFMAFKAQSDANEKIQSQFNIQNNNQVFFRLIDTLEKRITIHEIIHKDKSYTGYNMISKILDSCIVTGVGMKITGGEELFFNNLDFINSEIFDWFASQMRNRNVKDGAELKHRLGLFSTKRYRENEFSRLFSNNSDRSLYVINTKMRDIFENYFFDAPIEFQNFYYSVIFNPNYTKNEAFFDGYFKTLTSLLKHIERYDKDNFFQDFLVESLTKQEKIIIFYYIAGGKSSYNFNSLIHKFHVLNELKFETNYFAGVEIAGINLGKYIDRVIVGAKTRND